MRRAWIWLLLSSALAIPASAGWLPFSSVILSDPLKKDESLYQQGAYPGVITESKRLVEKRIDSRQKARAYWLMGKSYEALGKLDKAVGVYQVAVKMHPEDVDLLVAIADIFRRVGLDDRAQPQYQAALKLDPGNMQAHLGMGELLMRQGFFKSAVPHFKKVLEKDGENLGGTLGLARSLSGSGDLEKAEATLRKGLQVHRTAEAWAGLADVVKRRGDLEEAIRCLKEALVLAPDRKDLRQRQLFWLLEAARTEEAEAGAREFLEGSTGDPLASFVLGMAALRRGDVRTAALWFAPAAEQDKHPFLRKAAQGLLSEIRGMQP